MSLAIYAAPFNDDNSNNNTSGNLIQQKKQTHNKTQKRYPKPDINTDKVNSVLSNIHDSVAEDDNDRPILGDFTPPPPPESAGVNRTESMQSMNPNTNVFRGLVGKSPEPNNESRNEFDMHNYESNYGNNKSIEDYYKKVLPSYKNTTNKQYYKGEDIKNVGDDVVMQKLNYMINLLEEQQDEKTNNVTEEVVLYSFLGIFIIFVVDSFARAGKYVR